MILLDTHVLLWWQSGGERLSVRAAREIARADAVLVSPISCWEITMLIEKERVVLDRPPYTWVRDLLEQERIELASLSAQAAVGAALLPGAGFGGDPADAFLYASARELVVPLVTKDANIRSFARATKDVRTIW